MEKSFDRVADIYDETRRMEPHAMARIMENILNEIGPTGGPILEMGIGTGRIAIPMAERGLRIVGVDLAEKMLMRLREKLADASLDVAVVRGEVGALPFSDGSFRAAIAVHVFHLLDGVRACLRETRRVLSPNGRLLFGGEQRLLRYVEHILQEKHGLKENLIETLTDIGFKLPDQDEVERQVKEGVRAMGGEFRQLPPVEWDHEITCGDVIERIEGREASYLWDMPEAEKRNLAGRIRDAFSRHVGPPSTVIRFRRRFNMFCARF